MMNLLKKKFALLLAVLLCLGLTACKERNEDPDVPVVGNDWRVTGIVRGSGTITRGGEDTFVLVCVHKSDAAFYYDSEEQIPFAGVEYPITFGDNVWDIFKSIDFADPNGDGNSDVTMRFNDGAEYLIVWFWDTESLQFVYQPDNSNIPADN